MYKELVIRNVIILAVSLLMFFCFSMFVIDFINKRNLENQIKYLSVILVNNIQETNSELEIREVVNTFTASQSWLNVVIANSYGDIIIDSRGDVADGLLNGKIESFEMDKLQAAAGAISVYLNGGRIYGITRVNGDIVFRASMDIEDNNNIILLGLLILAVVFISVLFVTLRLTGKTSMRITDAFDNIENHLRKTVGGHYTEIDENHRYTEVSCAYRQINAVNKSLYLNIMRIIAERDKLDFIVESINEGILILGVSGKVYIANDYAREVLGITEISDGANYGDVITDVKLRKMILKEIEAKTEQHYDYLDEATQRNFLVSFKYLNYGEKINDEDIISVILYDVTALRKEEKRKADFIANASHELKTPITSISGFSELLLSGLVTSEEDMKQYIGSIHDESVRMKNTVNELLYLSKLDYSDEIKNKTDVNLYELAGECIKNHSATAKEKGVELILKPGFATVSGDYSLLSRMIGNLLDNSVKYNREGGNAVLETGYNEKGKAYLKVSDNGYGIQPKHLQRLFDRFYRVDNSRNRDTGGTGLGLAIVQKICALHGAEIKVDSVYGKGSEFTVTFEKEN